MKSKITLLFTLLAGLSCMSDTVARLVIPDVPIGNQKNGIEPVYVLGNITYIDEAEPGQKMLFINFDDPGSKIKEGLEGNIYHNMEGIKNEYSVGACKIKMRDGKQWLAQTKNTDLTDNIASGAIVRVRVN